MGYYTDYDISKNSEEVKEVIRQESEYCWNNEDVINAKWYSSGDDMRRASLKFPGEMLYIECVGEESADIWRAFYKDGRECVQRAKLVYPDHYTPADWN